MIPAAITWPEAIGCPSADPRDLDRRASTRAHMRAMVQERLVPLLRERGPMHWEDAASTLGISRNEIINASLAYRRTISLDAGWLYLHPHLGVR